MAYILKLPVKLPRGRFAEPFEDWTPEQWARFRTELKEAFQRDLESNPKSSSEKTDKK